MKSELGKELEEIIDIFPNKEIDDVYIRAAYYMGALRLLKIAEAHYNDEQFMKREYRRVVKEAKKAALASVEAARQKVNCASN